MKYKIKYLCILLILIGAKIVYCYAHSPSTEPNTDRIQLLNDTYAGVTESTGEQRKKYEEAFFTAFPASFEEIDELYFYQTKDPEGFQKYFSEQFAKYNKHLELLSNLQYIAAEKYDNKYIDIAISGKKKKYFDSRIESYHEHLLRKVLNNIESLLIVLSKREEQEIIDFFDFLLITYLPYKSKNKGIYQSLCNKIKLLDSNSLDKTVINRVVEKYIHLYNRVALLKESYNQISNSKGEEERKCYEQLFFDAFPDSFQSFKDLYFIFSTPFYEGSKVPSELKQEEVENHIWLFYRLAHIDKTLYYNKYINIASKGKWEIKETHNNNKILKPFYDHLFRKFFYNPGPILALLSKHQEEEIVGFFEFVLNGPVPKYLRDGETYKKLWNKLKGVNVAILRMPSVKRLFQQYISLEQQAHLLIEYCERAFNSTGKTRVKYERLFFNHFPSSFLEFQALYLYNEIIKHGPLEKFLYRHTRFFCNLSHINKKRYYNKYINLYVVGASLHPAKVSRSAFGITDSKHMLPWLARLALDIQDKIVNDPSHMITLLAKLTDSEIRDIFWSLFYDARYKSQVYDKLYTIISKQNIRISQLLQEAYTQILSY